MKNNGLKYIVIAALLLNAATLVFFWLKFASSDGEHKPPPDLLAKELNLDAQQMAAFDVLKKQHREKHGQLLQQITNKRKVLYASKPALIDSTVHQIGLLQEEIEVMTLNHWADVRKICTPEQQAKLDTVLYRAVQHILNPRPNRKPPPKRE